MCSVEWHGSVGCDCLFMQSVLNAANHGREAQILCYSISIMFYRRLQEMLFYLPCDALQQNRRI